ncbi:hypothetical protein SKAU_G00343920 [Synaphobranchus kaupii]|uniref:Uncharacterized protein n=1 Tax=Synaphobranchus kaupii TaxID=118154 RepID=A0A9Q1EJ78_SYNKA|nr:hypothetical protein SKAU_G00343920 [Synaphobranchus kaupii]
MEIGAYANAAEPQPRRVGRRLDCLPLSPVLPVAVKYARRRLVLSEHRHRAVSVAAYRPWRLGLAAAPADRCPFFSATQFVTRPAVRDFAHTDSALR